MPPTSQDKKRLLNSLKETLIGGRFRILHRLGGGSFGEVYKGINIDSGVNVAIKLEDAKDHSRAILEHRIYSHFNECALTVGIPQTYFAGRVGDYNVVVMELLGPNLEELFNICSRRFSVKSVCMIGIQAIQRLQYMHSMNYIHRDIKPENFVMGIGDNSQILYIIDMGLAKRYRDPVTVQHIPWEDNRSLTGTARYVSINTHKGIQQSRRDDMESLLYLLIYLLRGNLPWQGMKAQPSDTRYERIRDVKISTTAEKLFEGFPTQFVQLLNHTRSLDFKEIPNYSFCVRLLYEALTSLGETFDYQYSWLVKLDPHRTEERGDTDSIEEDTIGQTKHSTVAHNRRVTSTNATLYRSFSEDECDSTLTEENNNEDSLVELRDIYSIDFFF